MPGEPERGDARWITRMVRTAPEAIQIALRMLGGEMVQLRAMALTYISLFALVPGLVVAFSVVQAFTGMDRISTRLHEFLIENLAVGARATIEPYLDRFVQNTHLTSAGLVGGALLVWSSVSLFQNVDGALNDIWGVRRRRSLAQQAITYWVAITLGPLLLAGSVMVGHSTRAALSSSRFGVFQGSVAGALLTCAFFSLVYLIVPNTKVRLRNAAAGGLIAGLAWELAKWGYATFVARSVRYSAIYGSVAAIPIFILWLYLSWAILLFGARLAYVFQYASSFLRGGQAHSKTGREIVAGRVMLAVARAFDAGAEPPDAGEIASELGCSADDASDVALALKAAGLVVAVADGGLVPARPIEKITLLDVRRAVSGKEPPLDAGAGLVAAVVRGVEDEAAERLADVTFRTLRDRERGGAAGEEPEARPGRASAAGSPARTA
jgi:membrane protein